MSGTDLSSSAGAGPSRQPQKPPVPVKNPPVVTPGSGNNIIVNQRQRKNPLLECIKHSREFGDIVADFQVGRTTGIIFLSLKYHRLHPEYISQRVDSLGSSYNLRILLVLCDISEHQGSIRELTKKCLINNITIIVAWRSIRSLFLDRSDPDINDNLALSSRSALPTRKQQQQQQQQHSNDEAGLYITNYKKLEHRPPTMIKERVDKDYSSVFRTALTSISKVNKTDVETLRSSIGSFADIAGAPAERLEKLPGFGQVKVKRLRDVFDKPFQRTRTVVNRSDAQPRLASILAHPPDDPQDVESDITVFS